MRDVIVVGAGLAGSSIAATLAVAGWDVLLIERDRFPRHKVCGEFLSPEAQGSLHALGLLDDVRDLAPVALTAARLTSRRGASLQVELPGSAWGLSRYTLDAALAHAAAQRGAQLRTEITVLNSTPVDGGYAVQLRGRHGEHDARTTVHARAVVMACGRHSLSDLPPRTATGPNNAARRQHVGVKCHYENVPMPARVELFFFPGGYAGINPVEGGRANLCLLASYAAFARAGRSVADMLATAAAWNPALAERLTGATPLSSTECAVAPVDTQRPAHPWDGAACLGDTATMIPPLCGDGMAMALRSSELCAPLADGYLRGELSLAQWADAYCTAWHAEFDRRLRVGRALQGMLGAPFLAEVLLRMGQLAPPLADYFVRATRGQAVGASA